MGHELRCQPPPSPKLRQALPVIGWRGWKIRDGWLRPFGDDTPPAVPRVDGHDVEAICIRGSEPGACPKSDDGRLPGERCQCGIYALATLEAIYASCYGLRRGIVTAQVALGGKVVVSENK